MWVESNNNWLDYIENPNNNLSQLLSLFESKGLETESFNYFYEISDIDEQKEILDYFNKSIDNKDLLAFLDEEWFPSDFEEFNTLKNKFKILDNWEKLLKDKINKHEYSESNEKQTNNIFRDLLEKNLDFFHWTNLSKIKDNKEFVKSMIEFLQEEDRYLELLEKSAEKWEEEFENTYTSLKSLEKLWGNFSLLDQKVDSIKLEFIIRKKNPYYSKENISIWLIIDWSWKLEKDGDTISYWDQKIDFWEKPPVKYIVWKNWFEIKSSKLDFKLDRKIKKEIQDKQTEIKNNKEKITKIDENLSKLTNQKNNIDNLDLTNQSTLDDIKSNYPNTKLETKIDQILEHDLSQEVNLSNPNQERSILENHLKQILKDIINTKINDLNISKLELENTNTKLENKVWELKSKQETQLKNYEEKIKEKDKNTRKVSEVYTDLLQDSIDNKLFQEIIWRIKPSNPIYLSNWKIITNINLETLEITWSWLSLIDKANHTWPVNKKYFAETMNIILSWDPNYPINIDSMDSINTTFKDTTWKNIDRVVFSSWVKNRLWTQALSVMINNIEKSKTNIAN